MGCAPVQFWPLGWVSMIPLWQILQRPLAQAKQPQLKTSLIGGLIWGLAYHGTALSWIVGIHPMTWLGISWGRSLTIALLAWGFVTLWGAAIVVSWIATLRFLQSRLALSLGQQVVMGTALWCLVERLWNTSPLFWTGLSLTQSPGNINILQLSQIGGPAAVTASLVAVNGLLSAGLAQLLTSSSSQPARHYKGYWISAAGLFISLHLVGHSLAQRPLSTSPDQAVRVGLIQGNLPTQEKMTPAGIQESYQRYLEGYEQLVEAGADIVFTPEGAIPQRWNAFLADRNLLMRAVKAKGIPMILGSFSYQTIDDTSSPLMQTLLSLTPEGIVSDRYAKIKLVPLGEYMPFPRLLGRFSPFGQSMTPGSWQQQFDTPIGPLAAGICFDSAFSNLFRTQVKRGGVAIITASNNDPYSRWQMMQHHALDVMHAIETDRWAIRVTNTGISAIVDPRGKTRWIAPDSQQVTHLTTIFKQTTLTPYVRWGDWLAFCLLFAGGLWRWVTAPVSSRH